MLPSVELGPSEHRRCRTPRPRNLGVQLFQRCGFPSLHPSTPVPSGRGTAHVNFTGTTPVGHARRIRGLLFVIHMCFLLYSRKAPVPHALLALCCEVVVLASVLDTHSCFTRPLLSGFGFIAFVCMCVGGGGTLPRLSSSQTHFRKAPSHMTFSNIMA